MGFRDHGIYDDVSSPTARTESVLIVAGIAAAEARKARTLDIGGAFLNVDITKTGIKTFVRLDKIMTSFLVRLDASYAKFVNPDGSCVVQLDRALYGTIEAARLWYETICGKLQDSGFIKNPYDECVYNKIAKSGKQITVAFHVDDLLVTCEDEEELDEFTAMLRRAFPEVTEHRGDVLDYLAITLDFTTVGEVQSTVKKLVDDIIAGNGMTTERKTPSSEELLRS